jgi:hypothetical protein
MRGATSPGLALVSLSIDDVQRMFEPEFVARLRGIDLCGAYGDPILAPDLLEIVRYFRANSPDALITLYTNGGVRKPQWWTDLATIIGRPSRVVFGIDGIDEVSEIYRRKAQIGKVMTNARAFIEAGGAAQWDFLVFEHNEHQVEQARTMSREWGFVEFQPKKTGRFVRSAMEHVPELDGVRDPDRFPIFSPHGDEVGELRPPSSTEWRNESGSVLLQLSEIPGGVERMLDTTPIDCRVKHDSSIYIGAQGYVFPCCQTYTAATLPSVYGRGQPVDAQMEAVVLANGGFEAVNAKRVGLRAAVESRLMSAIQESWEQKAISEGRLKVCARVCGTTLGTFQKQFASPALIPGRVPDAG